MKNKLIFLYKGDRTDLEEAGEFLTTRVKTTEKDDYKKLFRVMKYLQENQNLYLTLEADNTHMIK